MVAKFLSACSFFTSLLVSICVNGNWSQNSDFDFIVNQDLFILWNFLNFVIENNIFDIKLDINNIKIKSGWIY